MKGIPISNINSSFFLISKGISATSSLDKTSKKSYIYSLFPPFFSLSLSLYFGEILYYNTIKGYNSVVANYTAERQLTERYATVTIAWAFHYERSTGQLALLNYSQLTHSPPAFTLSRENFIPRRGTRIAKGVSKRARAHCKLSVCI